MDETLITVIVPVYNIMDCLEKCVDSIISQTYRNLDIILVDDGSTDGTQFLVDTLAERDDRIRVFHKENGGSSSARNLGIQNAFGEYLGFVDSDDYIEPDMYEKLLMGINKYKVNIAQIGRDEIDANGKQLPSICDIPLEDTLSEAADFMHELLMHRGDCSFCTKLVKKELFGEMGFPEGRLNEDFYLLINMLSRGERILSVSSLGYHVFYRIGSNSRKKSTEQFSRVFKDCVDNADVVGDIVSDKFPQLKKVALRFGAYQRLEYLLHIPVAQMVRSNKDYVNVVKWVRRNYFSEISNKFLNAKNKVYLTLFAIAPKGIRVIHKKIRGL